MKILVVGAGAVGGYFGGRLHEKGADVTFLVRQKRKEQLEKDGLVIESVNGNLKIEPQLITAEDKGAFDLILIGTKAYHFNEAIESVKPFVHESTVLIPMLNGISHVEQLQETFSPEQVIGGLCFIESTVTQEGVIRQTSGMHHFLFGELNGETTDRIKKIEDVFSGTKAKFKLSDSIVQELWNKYLFITTMSGVTTLFEQPIGPILELPEGAATIKGLIGELSAIMRADGAPLAADVEEQQFGRFLGLEYNMKSSMQRDMEKGSAVEVDHLQGFLLGKARNYGVDCPYLTVVYANLKLYEKTI